MKVKKSLSSGHMTCKSSPRSSGMFDFGWLDINDERIFFDQLQGIVGARLFKQWEKSIWLHAVRKLVSAKIESLPQSQISLYLTAVKAAEARQQEYTRH